MWGEARFRASVIGSVLGVRGSGSMGEEKLVGVLDGNHFLIHGFHFDRDVSRITEL
jgi:hypothetical protein